MFFDSRIIICHPNLFQDADKKVVFMNIKELGESHAAFYQEQCWVNSSFISIKLFIPAWQIVENKSFINQALEGLCNVMSYNIIE